MQSIRFAWQGIHRQNCSSDLQMMFACQLGLPNQFVAVSVAIQHAFNSSLHTGANMPAWGVTSSGPE